MENKYPCPSCGFLVFDREIGSYEICPICRWEDDHVQLAYPGLRGGANQGSLKNYQDFILTKIPVDVKEYQGYKRHLSWRPLRDEECLDQVGMGTGIEYFHAASETEAHYYWELDS